MWLSKLNDMSIGPLWALRQPKLDRTEAEPEAAPAACPVCGAPWCQPAAQGQRALVVLAAPITDPAQQTLLQNCLRSVGWEQAEQFDLHGACAVPPDTVRQALQAQLIRSGVQTMLVFGDGAVLGIEGVVANQVASQRGRVLSWHGLRLVLTWHPEQILADAGLKAQVWADLCLAAYDA